MKSLENNVPAVWTAEIIAVGTELLMGEVTNTNAVYLSQMLNQLGVHVYYHTSVGDNPERIQSVFRHALSRSHIILVTGGLGPTDDDLTVSTLADLLNTPLVSDTESEEAIRRFFITRDMPMSTTNLKQALRPQDAEVIPNRMGTAPGLFWNVTAKVHTLGWGDGPKLILAFPGVPREMKTMWVEEAVPRLKPYFPQATVLVSRSLKFMGIGESMLAEKLRDLMANDVPTVSPYVGQAEVRIRLATKASTEADAWKHIEPVEAEILSRVGEYYYGKDDESLEQIVGQLLRQRQAMLAVAESCTGGLLSSRLTDVPGSSDYIVNNVVTYSNESKQRLLGVSAELLETYGAVSEPVAAAMAQGVLALTGAQYGLAITGIAGPGGGSIEKPVGTSYIACVTTGQKPTVSKVTVNPQYDRQYIKYWFSHVALNKLRQFLQASASA